MNYILFNPLSGGGKSYKYLKKLSKLLSKQNQSFEIINIIDNPFITFKEKLASDDSLILFGGDGTIHVLINQIVNEGINTRVFVYKAGSGNDFLRDYKGKFVEITKIIPTFPHIKYQDKEEIIINGVGTGIDAAVCNAHDVGDGGYGKNAIKLFMKFKKFPIELELDNNQKVAFNKTWFVSVQHGRFFGGGMKVSPKSKRDDDVLEVIVIHRVILPILLLIFPLIFLGWHLAFKFVGIKVYKTKFVKVKTAYPLLQRDGEVHKGADEFEVFFRENK